MNLSRFQRIYLSIAVLLLSTLACRAASGFVATETPTPVPPTATFTPTLTLILTETPTPTPTPIVEVSCRPVTDQIIEESVYLYSQYINRHTGGFTSIVTYDVNGDEINSPEFETVDDTLLDEQQDQERHEQIWDYFTRLIPLEWRDFVSNFIIFTDGRSRILAGVIQSEEDPEEWVLGVDIVDSKDPITLTYTLIHEFGHLLTLNSEQVEVSLPVYNNPFDDEIYQQEVDACPRYFTGEGCSNPDSYMSLFFERFWRDIYEEWLAIAEIPDDEIRYEQFGRFYATYFERFVSDYSATNPAEDIAESFAFFILAPKPDVLTTSDEKIMFFYDYPKLVELRAQILGSVCAEFDEP